MTFEKKANHSVAIVTVTYNAEAFIQGYAKAVKDLLETDSRFKLVVIDNDSQDNTVSWLENFFSDKIHTNTAIDELNDISSGSQFENAQVIVQATGKNSGFGTGCNKGVALAGDVDYIWFLNPDTQIENSSAFELLNCLESDASISSVGSVLKNENGAVRSGAFRFPQLGTVFLSGIKFGLLDRLFSNKTISYNPSRNLEFVDWLTGASFMIRREHFDEVGGFDEQFFLYFEEVDLFFRLKQKAYKAVSCNKSIIYHISGASTGVNKQGQTGLLPRKPKYWFESRRLFYLKNYGRFYFLLIDITFVVASFLERVKAFILRKKITRNDHVVRDVISHSAFKS